MAERDQRPECAKDIQEALSSSKSAHHRIDGVEIEITEIKSNNKILHEMNTNIAVLATEFKHQGKRIESIECDVKELKCRPVPDVSKDVSKLEVDVEKIKSKPEKRMDTIVTVIITALGTGIIMFILNKVFGG